MRGSSSMRIAILRAAVLLALLAGPAGAQEAGSAPPRQDAAAEWKAERTDAWIPMRDGAKLAADVFLPSAPGRYPAVLVQTPYDRTKMRLAFRLGAAGAPRAGDGAGQGGFGEERSGASIAAGIVDRERTAVVVADWRGFFGSRGAGGMRPGGLGRDGYDSVEWTAAQPWCDGKVGTWGPSALGVVQFQTAAEAPPHLVCAVPLVSGYGNSYDDYFQDGVFREHHAASLDRLGFGTGGGSVLRAANRPDALVWTLAARAQKPQKFDVPMLLVTGWFDHGIDRTLATWTTIRSEAGTRCRSASRLVVGPWHHMAVGSARQGDIEFPAGEGAAAAAARAFFDLHLHGDPPAKDAAWNFAEGPPVRLLRAGESAWIAAAEWPRPAGAAVAWTLGPDGTIGPSPAAALDASSRTFIDDPANPCPTVGGANLPLGGQKAGLLDQRSLLGRPDVLSFAAAAQETPLRLEGAATLRVRFRTDSPDTDLAARLCVQRSDGSVIVLCDTAARASFGASSRTHQPEALRELTLRFPVTAFTFARGERLRLLVSGSNWPRFERNGHTGADRFDAATARPARIEIVFAGADAPVLTLPLAPDVSR